MEASTAMRRTSRRTGHAPRTPSWAVAVVALVATVGCDGSGSAAKVQRALDQAAAGDTIELPEGVIKGALVVPAGVTLRGDGTDTTLLIADPDEPALTVAPSGNEHMPTRVEDLTVLNGGGYGVVSSGKGHVVLERISVRVERGVAIGLEETSGATLRQVHVQAQSPRDPDPSDPTPENSPSHGLVLAGVADAQLADVTADGFAAFGALLLGSTTTWKAGSASDNFGTGLMVHGGSASLHDLSICGQRQGSGLLPAYGAVFVEGADVQSTALEICETEGVGLFQASASGTHTDLVAQSNDEGAVWAQNTDQLELSGAGTRLTGNGLAGLVAVESSGVTLADGRIEGTFEQPRVISGKGLVPMGDGVQLVGSTEDIQLRNLALVDNSRVGMLLDLGGQTTEGVSIQNVTVDGSGEQLGAIAQGGDVRAAWDSGITRSSATLANDTAFEGALEAVEAVAPSEYPSSGDLESLGLEVFGAVAPSE